jgi:putative MATE family efflux protein
VVRRSADPKEVFGEPVNDSFRDPRDVEPSTAFVLTTALEAVMSHETKTEAPRSIDHVPEPTRPSMMALIRESLAGGDRDYTSGPVGRAVVLLAIPMMLEMAMESVFALADVIFVSRLGVEAVAAVGLTEAVLSILYSIAAGLAMATTAMVSRRVGEKRHRAASTAAVQAVLIGVLVSVVFGVVGFTGATTILGLMGGSPELVEAGGWYTRIVLGGSLTVFLLFVNNAALRGAGDAAAAMKVLWFANGVNLVLDPCLIFGLGPFPEMGLTGAAIATTLGRGAGVLVQLVLLARGTGRLRPVMSDLRPKLSVMARLLRVSFGGMMQALVAHSSWVFLVRLVSGFGSPAVAGYTIAIRLIIFALLPSWGLSNSAATLMGQNLGAGRPDRAERSVWAAGLFNAAFLTAVAIVFIAGAETIIGWFTADPAVVASGVACLRIVAYGYGFYAVGMVMVQAFNGAGDTTTPTVINVFCYWLFQLPLAYALAMGVELGANGVYWAIPIAESLLTVVAMIVFRRGRWKDREI